MKNTMKKTLKLISVILAAALLISFASCSGGSSDNTTDNSSAPSADAVTYKIGLCNFVDDASLNQIVANIKSQLAALGEENGVTFDINEDNCNADSNVLSQIISNFTADKVDLMIAIATPVAMAMQAATEDSDIPVVFAAVSDPVGSGIVESMEAPGANITGTSDYLDTNAIMNLIFAADPDAQNIGLLYDLGQDASTTAIADAKAYLDSKGVKYTEATGTTVDEVVLAAQSLITTGVDAVFTPTDNTIMTAELSIYEALAEAGIPHYTGADSFALNGAFLGYGVDYANLGRVTGDMVADILLNSKNPGEVAVRTFDNGTATINTETLEAIGFDYDTIVDAFTPYCTSIQDIVTAESFDD